MKKIMTLSLLGVIAGNLVGLQPVLADVNPMDGTWETTQYSTEEITSFTHTSDDYFELNPGRGYATTFDYIAGIDRNAAGAITNPNDFGHWTLVTDKSNGDTRDEWSGVYRPYNKHDGKAFTISVGTWASLKMGDEPFMNPSKNKLSEMAFVNQLVNNGTIDSNDLITIEPYTNISKGIAGTTGWKKSIFVQYKKVIQHSMVWKTDATTGKRSFEIRDKVLAKEKMHLPLNQYQILPGKTPFKSVTVDHDKFNNFYS
ncbi:MAG: hypothetical protein LBT80_08100 [Lactobacillaceae bacterium]|nr:hypothetical protein [Lactobacillaceae bacterium]